MRATLLLALAISACDGAGGGTHDLNRPPATPDITLSPVKPRTRDALELQTVHDPTDPDGDPVTLHVAWTVDGIAQPDLADAMEVGASHTTVGQHWSASVSAVDDHEASSKAAVVSVDIDNSPPVVTLSTDPASPPAHQDLVLHVATHDDDDDPVTTTTTWTLDGNAAPTFDDLTTIPGDQTVRGQTWSAHVIPDDGREHGKAADLDIVIADTPPVIGTVVIGPVNPREGDTLTATATATDDEAGDVITYEYAWLVGGVTVAGQTARTLDSASFDKGDEVQAQVIAVSDHGGRSAAVDSNTVTVQNTAPTLAGASVSPTAGNETTHFSCAPTGLADVDPADSPTTQVSWTVQGATVGTFATLDGRYFSRGNSIACTLTPQDGTATGAARASSAVTIGNAPPSLTSVALGAPGAVSGDTLTATPSGGADLDGDAVSYRYAWAVNGSAIAGTGATHGTSVFGRGDSVVVTATPYDGIDTGVPVSSAPLILGNAPPTIAGLTWSPEHANAFQDLTIVPDAQDPDGDTLTFHYAWTVAGVAAGGNSATLSHSAFTRGKLVGVTVQASDGFGGTAQQLATTLIGDAAPSAPTVTVEPVDPLSNDDLLCQLDRASTDPEGDTIVYTMRWTVDGTIYDHATPVSYPSSEVLHTATLPGQTWGCAAVASDGTYDTVGPEVDVLVQPVSCGQNAADDGDGNCVCDLAYTWCDASQVNCCYAPPTQLDFTIVSASIATTKPNGTQWDSVPGFYAPDVYTTLKVDTVSQGSTAYINDTYSPVWNYTFGYVTVSTTSVVTFVLSDDDTLADDHVDSFSIPYSDLLSYLDQGEITIHGTSALDFTFRVDTP